MSELTSTPETDSTSGPQPQMSGPARHPKPPPQPWLASSGASPSRHPKWTSLDEPAVGVVPAELEEDPLRPPRSSPPIELTPDATDTMRPLKPPPQPWLKQSTTEPVDQPQPPPPPKRRPGRDRDQRADIQALRAVAVTLVMLNHLWPGSVTGGYIGVDVFFVISGFLITSSLVSHPPRRPRDLAAFWGRRVRRLLPAACLVLALTVGAVLRWGPQTLVADTAYQATASAIYIQNWVLASNATDYFAASATHTAVQHYWSLSVEEQFYIVWPILILVLAWLVRRLHWRWSLQVGLGAMVVASLAVSVWYTNSVPSAAYFVTYTRAWELAAGGLLAVLVARGLNVRSRAARTILAWGGLAAIVVCALLLNASTRFPGYIAAAPVAGALAIIAAGSDGDHGSPWTLWRAGPVQWLGDISYSVYLWHWPVIILAPAILATPLTWQIKLGVVAAILAASWLSKRFVEDTFRYWRPLVKSLPRTFLMGLIAMLIVALVSNLVMKQNQQNIDNQRQATALGAKGFPPRCRGAGSLLYTDCPAIEPNTLFVSPVDAKVSPWLNCNTYPPFAPHTCTFGSNDADTKKILLIGNSHAGQWLPLLDTLGKKDGWSGFSLVGAGCIPYIGMEIDYGNKTYNQGCKALGDEMLARATSGDYDLVIYSTWPNDPIVGRKDHWKAVAESQQAVFDMLTAAGVRLLVIRDTPHAIVNLPNCVSSLLTGAMPSCDYPDLTMTQSQDPMFNIASQSTLPNVYTASINDLLCTDGTCHAIVGGLITYQDDNHLSVDFANSLAPRIEPILKQALK